MKKLLTIILFLPCYLFAQQNVNTDNTLIVDTAPEPDIMGVNPAVVAMKSDLKTISDTTKALRAAIITAQSAANDATALAGAALSASNTANTTNSNQALTLTTHTNQIASLQTQVNNIAIPQNVGIPAPLVINSSYTLKLTDYDKTIFVNCSGCVVYAPSLTPGFRVLLVREATSGTVYVKGSGAMVAGASSIAVKGGSQWLTYKTSTSANLQVR